MYFQYGNYQHAIAEVGLVATQRPIYSPRGYKKSTRHSWALQGALFADSPAELTTAVNAMEDAYSVDGYDAGLYLDNGTVTHLFLDSSQTIGGVRIVSLDFPENGVSTAEYTTYRSYSIQIEADYPHTENSLLSFSETLNFVGTGGPRDIYIQTLKGTPQKQRVFQRTTQRITQSGSAVGFTKLPPIPGPLFPQSEIFPERRITLASPQNLRGFLSDYSVQWQYVFETTNPQTATPNVR